MEGALVRRRVVATGLLLAAVILIVLVLIRLGNQTAQADPHRDAWERAKVHSYRLTVEVVCFCPPLTYGVTVEDGRADEPIAFGEDADETANITRLDDAPRTVEDLFELIAGAKDSYGLDVRYNSIGVPTHIAIDAFDHVSDDEVSYEVTFDRIVPSSSLGGLSRCVHNTERAPTADPGAEQRHGCARWQGQIL